MKTEEFVKAVKSLEPNISDFDLDKRIKLAVTLGVIVDFTEPNKTNKDLT